MKYILYFISFLITNTCLVGNFLTSTAIKLSVCNMGFLSSATAFLRNSTNNFPISKEQELIKFVQNEQKDRDCFKNKSFEEVKTFIFSNLNNFKKNSLITPFTPTNDSNNSKIHDIQTTFNSLKEIMNIPREVELFKIENNNYAAASYNPVDRVVYLKTNFNSQSPTIIFYHLIHEFCHVKQHQEKGLHNFIINTPRPILEHDADTKATALIKCPLCIKTILAHYSKLPEAGQKYFKSLGNFNKYDFKNCLQQKSLNDVCKAHKNIQNPDIWSGLDSLETCKKIEQDDHNFCPISDRLFSKQN